MAFVTRQLATAQAIRERLHDAAILLGLAVEENDSGSLDEVAAEVIELDRAMTELRLRTMFTGRYHHRSAVVIIEARDGDVGILVRMLLRWAERRSHRTEVTDRVEDPNGDLRSAVLTVTGPLAYGMLVTLAGRHRIVHVDPLARDGRRRTVATIEVVPLAEDDDALTIADDDMRIDVFHWREPGHVSSGPDRCAVRLTHLPTGITVNSWDHRTSLWYQRRAALQILRSRLLVPPATRLPDEEVRSYAVQRRPLVRDPRTGYETTDVYAVLDGDLDPFIAAVSRRAST